MRRDVVRTDIQRWEQKYADKAPPLEIAADPSLVGLREHFTGEGRSLDVACGMGDNAIFLGELGYESYAVDGSFTAVSMTQARARARGLQVHAWVADLDTCPLPARAFDAVVVVRFLNRSLIETFQTLVKPGGILFYKTFNMNFLAQKPDFPRSYVLAPGELAERFSTCQCLATNDNPDNQETETYWLGRLVALPE